MALSRIRLALFVALVAIYVAVRLWGLDDSCLWFDEMFSVHAAEHELGPLLRFVALDLVHPPLFYLVLKLWISIGGESIFWLRLLSVLFSFLTIAPLWFFIRELHPKERPDKIVLFGLFLLAVNGSLIKYAQEVRMYSMLMFLSLMSIWLFARYFYRGKSWLWLVIVNILLVYTHYYGWLVIGCEIVAIIVFQRMKWRRIVGMAATVFAVFLPWLLLVVNAARSGNDIGQNIVWIERPGLRELFEFALKQIEPFYFQASNVEPASIYSVSIPLLLLFIVASMLWLASSPKGNGERAKFVLIFAFVPLVAAVAGSWILPYSVWGTRHLIVIAGPVAIHCATAVDRLSSSKVRVAMVTLVILFASYAAYQRFEKAAPDYVWCAWEKLLVDIKPDSAPANIYTSENFVAYHSWFATRHRENFRTSVIKGLDTVEDKTYFIPRGFDEIRKAELADVKEPHVILLYRIEKPLLNDQLFQELKGRGYEACPPRVLEYGPSTAFRVEMTREPGTCIYPF